MKDKIIIINAYPKGLKKIGLLTEQISYLKKLNIPILLVSGCEVPEFIQKEIDYLIINTENERIEKDFYYDVKNAGIHDITYEYLDGNSYEIILYSANVNSTITKNIKLGFNLAKQLGYKRAFYTEDDNIWKDGSFNYINELYEAVDNDNYKISGVLGKVGDINTNMIFTTFFCADINFFLIKFIIPHEKKDWYNLDNIKKHALHRTYEEVFYNLLIDDLSFFYDTSDSFTNELIQNNPENQSNVAWGVYKRYDDINYILNTYFVVLPTSDNKKTLFLYNKNFDGRKLEFKVILWSGESIDMFLGGLEYCFFDVTDEQWVDILIDNRVIRKSTNYDEIKYNGIINFF